jgi:hypothetical protein
MKSAAAWLAFFERHLPKGQRKPMPTGKPAFRVLSGNTTAPLVVNRTTGHVHDCKCEPCISDRKQRLAVVSAKIRASEGASAEQPEPKEPEMSRMTVTQQNDDTPPPAPDLVSRVLAHRRGEPHVAPVQTARPEPTHINVDSGDDAPAAPDLVARIKARRGVQ